MTEDQPLWNVANHAFHRALEQQPPLTNEQVWAASASAVRNAALQEVASAAAEEGRKLGEPAIGHAIATAILALKSPVKPA